MFFQELPFQISEGLGPAAEQQQEPVGDDDAEDSLQEKISPQAQPQGPGSPLDESEGHRHNGQVQPLPQKVGGAGAAEDPFVEQIGLKPE